MVEDYGGIPVDGPISTRMGHSVSKIYRSNPNELQFSFSHGGGNALEESVTTYFQKIFSLYRNNSPNGTWGGTEEEIGSIANPSLAAAGVEDAMLPRRYLSNRLPEEGKKPQILLDGRSCGGAAIEILVSIEPQLFDAFLHARNGGEGLREVAKLINGIEPGLYHKIFSETGNKSQDMVDLFTTVYKLAIDRGIDEESLYKSWEKVQALQHADAAQ